MLLRVAACCCVLPCVVLALRELVTYNLQQYLSSLLVLNHANSLVVQQVDPHLLVVFVVLFALAFVV